MRRRLAVVRLICCVALLGTAATACPGRRPAVPRPSGTSPSPETGRPGGTLRMTIADDAGALDPQIAAEPGAFGLVRATQRGLFAFPSASGEAGTIPVPDLAEGPPVSSPDGLVHTFRLRAGLRFGPPASRALTAADVVAGLTRAVRLGGAGGSLRVLSGADAVVARRAATVAGLAAPDARTVTIRLVRPSGDLLWMLATPAASAVPAGLGDAVSPRDISPSGPYRLGTWEPGVRIRLVRNQAWTKASDPVRAAWVDAIEARVAAAAANGDDLIGEGVRPAGPTVAVNGGCLLYLFLNARVGRLAEPRVRAGIAEAIGRAAVVDAFTRASGAHVRAARSLVELPATGPVTPSPNPSAARARIGRAFETRLGFERRGPDAAADTAAGETIIRQLAAAGVTARALLGPGAIGPSAYDLYERGTVPMGVGRWCPEWPGRPAGAVVAPLLGSGGAANYSRTSDRELDRLLGAATAAEEARAAPALDALLSRAVALGTVVPLVFYDEPAQVSRRVRGFVPHPLFTKGDPAGIWLDT